MFKKVKLSYLNFLAKQAPEILAQKLSKPCLIDWDMGLNVEAEKMLATIRYHVHPETFERFLLCSALLDTSPIPVWFIDFVIGNVELNRYLPGWSFQCSKDTRWAVASFPAVSGHAAEICHLVIGACPGTGLEIRYPFNIDRLLGNESIRQIKTAILAITKDTDFSCFFVLPLFSSSSGPGISGKSHGLSVAISVKSLICKKNISENLIGTGQVDETGKVMPIGGLDRKAKIASQNGYTVFLFPRQSAVEFPHWAFPVENVDDAWLIAELFSPEHSHQLLFLGEITRFPEMFIDKLDQIPAVWFKNADFQRRLRPVMNQIQGSAVLASKLVKKCCKKFETLEPGTRTVWAGLLSETIIRNLVLDNPEQALAACTFHINMNNRIGAASDIRTWIKTGDTVEKRVRNINLNTVVRYWNHRLVARHNQYRFDPEINPELLEVIDIYAGHHKTDCRFGYNRRPNFGELCGTIAQNFGFCGPGFLDQVRHYTSLAQEAFGMNHCPETHQKDWHRQLNYLTYALLDAGKFPEARDILCRYLKIDTLENLTDIPPKHFSLWEHALICRYFSETGVKIKTMNLIDWMKKVASLMPDSHPGQLWACNLGKIMARISSITQAEKWFRKSLELCLSANAGPAIRVMALLPLSHMFKLNIITRNDLVGTENTVMKAINALNKDHFKTIKNLGFTNIPDRVYHFPHTVFPFSYR